MKKMMMTLAIALAAFAGNAGVVFWNTGNVAALPSYATDWQSQTVSFFLCGSAGYDTSALIASLQSGGALPGGTDATKPLGVSPATLATVLGTQVFADGSYAYGYGVVFSADGTQFAISDVNTSAIFAAGGNASLSLGGTTATGFTVYDITVVPEPTSMALFALGVAAIGLRRRFKK